MCAFVFLIGCILFNIILDFVELSANSLRSDKRIHMQEDVEVARQCLEAFIFLRGQAAKLNQHFNFPYWCSI